VDNDRAAAGAQAKQIADVADKDGTPFNLYVFAPASNANMRAVAYSEEGDTLLAFTFTARTKAAYDANFPVFVGLIQKYAREIPGSLRQRAQLITLRAFKRTRRQTPILGEEA